jgi:hypothetical protein
MNLTRWLGLAGLMRLAYKELSSVGSEPTQRNWKDHGAAWA